MRREIPVNPPPRRVNDAEDGTWEWIIPGLYFDTLTMQSHLLDYASLAFKSNWNVKSVEMHWDTSNEPAWVWLVDER